MIALGGVGLIDAEGVDPHGNGKRGGPNMQQGEAEVVSDGEGMAIQRERVRERDGSRCL